MKPIEAEWAAFDSRIKATYIKPKVSTARGASNAPLVLENGFRLGLFNLDISLERIDEMADEDRALVLVTGLVLPPRQALSLALVFHGEALERVGDRLEEIRQEPIVGGRKAGQPKGKSNKVRVYLHPTGIYLRQDSDPARIEPAEGMGAALWASEAWYADVQSEPDLPPVALTWLGYVGGLLEAMPRGVRLRWLQPPAETVVHLLVDPEDSKACPRCGRTGRIDEDFGTRRMRRQLPDGSEILEERAQSFCNACRGGAGEAPDDAERPETTPADEATELAHADELVEPATRQPFETTATEAVREEQDTAPAAAPAPVGEASEPESGIGENTVDAQTGETAEDEPAPEPAGADLSALAEPIDVPPAMGPLLRRLKVRTWRDALTLDLDALDGARGIGRTKLKRLHALVAEARKRGHFDAVVEPRPLTEAEVPLDQWIAESPWARWDPREALGRLGSRVLSVIERFELSTVAQLAAWHATAHHQDIPNYGRGAHRKLGQRLARLRDEGYEALVFDGPRPRTVQAFAEAWLSHLGAERDRARKVLAHRYVDGWTLEQTGEAIGCTRERIRQIAKREIERDQAAWGPVAQGLLEHAISAVDALGGIALTHRVLALLDAPEPWAVQLAMDLAADETKIILDILPGISTTLDRSEFSELRRSLRADVEARLESNYSIDGVLAALADSEIEVPTDDLVELAGGLLFISIDGERAWPNRQSTRAVYLGALLDAGEAISAAEVAQLATERAPDLEATARNAIVAFRQARQVLSAGKALWIHERNLPFPREALDQLAARCIGMVEAAGGQAVSAVHLLATLTEQVEVPDGVTPYLLRDALLQSGKVRGWRAGVDVAWKAGEVQRTSLQEWIRQIASEVEHPFTLEDLLMEVVEQSGCQQASAYNTAMQMSDELIGLGQGEYTIRHVAFSSIEDYEAAIAELEAVLEAVTFLSGYREPTNLTPRLAELVASHSSRVLWGLAQHAPGLETRRRGLLMWPKSRGARAWDAFGPDFVGKYPVSRPQHLRDHLAEVAGFSSSDVARHLMYDGASAGYLQRIGMGWFIVAGLAIERQVELVIGEPALVRLAVNNDEFVDGSPARELLLLVRERVG